MKKDKKITFEVDEDLFIQMVKLLRLGYYNDHDFHPNSNAIMVLFDALIKKYKVNISTLDEIKELAKQQVAEAVAARKKSGKYNF